MEDGIDGRKEERCKQDKERRVRKGERERKRREKLKWMGEVERTGCWEREERKSKDNDRRKEEMEEKWKKKV